MVAPVAEKVMSFATEGIRPAALPAESLAQFPTEVHSPLAVPNQWVGPISSGTIWMALLSIVTAPVKARARPSMLAPVFNVMEVAAMIVPEKVEFTPMVAELPTCQKMFPG